MERAASANAHCAHFTVHECFVRKPTFPACLTATPDGNRCISANINLSGLFVSPFIGLVTSTFWLPGMNRIITHRINWRFIVATHFFWIDKSVFSRRNHSGGRMAGTRVNAFAGGVDPRETPVTHTSGLPPMMVYSDGRCADPKAPSPTLSRLTRHAVNHDPQ